MYSILYRFCTYFVLILKIKKEKGKGEDLGEDGFRQPLAN